MNPFRKSISDTSIGPHENRDKLALTHLLLSLLADQYDANPDPQPYHYSGTEVLRRLEAYKHMAGYKKLRGILAQVH